MATPKGSAPVVGFNHNVKYGPRVYHVQTEDSGLPHAHYITHLFVGGNIVASMKTSYAEKAAGPDLSRVVRGLMEGQHKVMLKRLVSGEFDEMAERLSAQHYAPGVLADGTNTASYVNTAEARSAPAAKIVKPAVRRGGAAPRARGEDRKAGREPRRAAGETSRRAAAAAAADLATRSSVGVSGPQPGRAAAQRNAPARAAHPARRPAAHGARRGPAARGREARR